jgi:DEAD/DEAH box helicase domain-containing protein
MSTNAFERSRGAQPPERSRIGARRIGGGAGIAGIDGLVAALRADPRWSARFGHWHEVPAREPRTAPFPAAVDRRIADLYAARGITTLFDHQARAIDAALRGEDVLVATPTASGKTLCYAVPVLQALLESHGDARALFLFPTKALSQDQSAGLTALIEALGEGWHAFTYDGDTPPSVRRTLRDRGHAVLTNPWMLHAGILPNHAKWSELFRGLRYIVIDEVHTLAGVFGSSVANVLRRLVRIAHHYGSAPRFLCCSATLAEAASHAQRLLGRPVRVIDEDGSPSGRRIFGVYNPPLLNPVAGLRANALEEARELASAVCGPAHQTIFFCRRRTAVEVLTRYLKESAPSMGLSADEIRGYRGGYLPLLRREIEDGLRTGAVKVVVSTNALELGIDIGALDVAVLVGYPGSQSSFWQRAGRVGRRGKSSLVVQIAQSDPVDQYLARHPEYLFGAPKERTALDPDNLVILSEQVKCAAFELPFRIDRSASSAPAVRDAGFADAELLPGILDYLTEDSRLLHKRDDTWYWMADAYPAQDVTLSGEDPDNVLVLDADTKLAIGEIDRPGSITTVHQGAIYQVEGETWKIESFDHANRRAYARNVSTDYFTEAETDTSVRVLRLEEKSARLRAADAAVSGRIATADDTAGADATSDDGMGDASAHSPCASGEDCAVWRGEVHVTTVATQYKKIRFYTRENVGAEDIHLPPEELDTEAFVLTISEATATELGLAGGERGAAWRGVGTILRRVVPLVLSCQPQDLGLSTHVRSPHFLCPAIFLYDAVQGGVGLAELLYAGHRRLVDTALDVVMHCACRRGCPACVGPPEEVGALGKECAQRILAHLAQGRLEACAVTSLSISVEA